MLLGIFAYKMAKDLFKCSRGIFMVKALSLKTLGNSVNMSHEDVFQSFVIRRNAFISRCTLAIKFGSTTICNHVPNS